MCKCCQSCLESLYWSCCEERFCYDESIAKYTDEEWEEGRCYSNHTVSVDSLEPITKQPTNNNNHLHLDSNRLVVGELPIHALDIYKVFSKSMIFKDDVDVKKYLENEENAEIERVASKPYVGKVVSFEDEKSDAKVSDFEIMFQDELYGDHKMFKIEEEEEDEDRSPDGGIVMNVPEDSNPIQQDVKPAEKPPLPRVDSSRSIARESSIKSIQRPKGILLNRDDSSRSLARSNSRQDMLLKRGDSMNMDSKNLKSVLARLPQKSASFLSLSDLLEENKKKAQGDIFTISASDFNLNRDEQSQISKMPDTPLIKGDKLPKFFAETPVIGEYKAETSLQSILQTPDVIFTDSDYSMPRYYGRAKTIGTTDVQKTLNSSKSLPDLNAAAGGDKVSKRLSKLGSRLKPLIIKKHDNESLRHSTLL